MCFVYGRYIVTTVSMQKKIKGYIVTTLSSVVTLVYLLFVYSCWFLITPQVTLHELLKIYITIYISCDSHIWDDTET